MDRAWRLAAAAGIAALATIAVVFTDAKQSVFDDNSVLEFTIRAPFADLIARGRRQPDYVVNGALSYVDSRAGRRVDIDRVEVGVRGHTSLVESECEFPKLKLKLPDNNHDDGVFG